MFNIYIILSTISGNVLNTLNKNRQNLFLNFGPQHPAAHGVLDLILKLDREVKKYMAIKLFNTKQINFSFLLIFLKTENNLNEINKQYNLQSFINDFFIQHLDYKLFYFLLFCIIMFFYYSKFYKQINQALSPYMFILYPKKYFISIFIKNYIYLLIPLFCITQCFFPIFKFIFSFKLQILLLIFLISLITLGVILTIRIQILKQQFSIKILKVSEYPEYQASISLINFQQKKLQQKLLEKKYNDDLEEKNIINKLKNLTYNENIYNKNKNKYFFIINKKIGLLQNITIRWLSFYNFLLQVFLIILLFSYFYYFNINFQIATYIFSSNYIFFSLGLVFLYNFIQNYYILFKIDNNKNNDKLAISTFYKEARNTFYFNVSDKNFKLRILILCVTIFNLIIYILLNFQISTIIFQKIYNKNNLSLFELFFNIKFRPIIENFYINVNEYLFHSYLNLFMAVFFFLILSISILLFFFIVVSITNLIYLLILCPIFFNEKYKNNPLITPNLENYIIINIEKYKNGKETVLGQEYSYDIIWFKNFYICLKKNYKMHKIWSINFIKYNFYLLLIPLLYSFFLLISFMLIKFYYVSYMELSINQMFLIPILHKKSSFRSGTVKDFEPNNRKIADQFNDIKKMAEKDTQIDPATLTKQQKIFAHTANTFNQRYTPQQQMHLFEDYSEIFQKNNLKKQFQELKSLDEKIKFLEKQNSNEVKYECILTLKIKEKKRNFQIFI